MTIRSMIANGFGFTSLAEYIESGFWGPAKGLTFPLMLKTRVFKTKGLDEMQAEAKKINGDVELKKTLTWLDLTALGVGFMCGAGIFVSPGFIAKTLTGPALCLSYLVASLSAFLSSFCYAEFTTTMPMAGAAYNYIYSTLGEFMAWVTVSNLILEYILANAAAVRGFAPYLAILCNKESTFFLRQWKGYTLDGWGCGVTVVVTLILSWGIRESSTANAIITVIHVCVMLFIIIAGLTKSDRSNFKPFVKEGASWKNIFNGAAVSFFSFIGFDALATTAEEMKNPKRDMPIGILGAVSIVTVIYVMMCVTLCLMVPTASIDTGAAFAAAFEYVGMDWAKYIVSIGALLGIFTTTLIGVLGASRILVGCSRERMLPPFFALVGEKRQTPWVATWAIGLTSAGIALFTDFAELANMISIGTFLVFYVVAIGLLWLRCYVPGKTTRKGLLILLFHVFAIVGFALGFTLVWVLPIYADEIPYSAPYGDYDAVEFTPAGDWNHNQWKGMVAMACCFVASCISFAVFCKQDFNHDGFKVPFFPFLPALSIFVNTFLLGQLDEHSYKRFGWWTVAAVAIYALYGAVAQQANDKRTEMLSSNLPDSEDGSTGKRDMELAAAQKLAKQLDAAPMPTTVVHNNPLGDPR